MEFDTQSAVERERCLPVTVPSVDGSESLATSELGFVAFVVRPLYTALVAAVPSLASCITRMDKSEAAWRRLLPPPRDGAAR